MVSVSYCLSCPPIISVVTHKSDALGVRQDKGACTNHGTGPDFGANQQSSSADYYGHMVSSNQALMTTARSRMFITF